MLDIENNKKILEVHLNLYNLALKNGIQLYICGGVGISFMNGSFYRDHGDLDYLVLNSEDLSNINNILTENQSYDYKGISKKGSYIYNSKGVEIELGLLKSITDFVEKVSGKNTNVSDDDIDLNNIYTLNGVDGLCMKPSYYYKLREAFGGVSEKNKIDKEILDKVQTSK